MQFVAFFRNVNQGQRGHPTTADLLGAFDDAGYAEAVAFQSNGTVVFEAPAQAQAPAPAPADDAAGIAHVVALALATRTGLDLEVFVLALAEIAAIVDVHAVEPDAARRELTLHSGDLLDVDDPSIVREAARRRCRIAASGPGWTIAVNERDRESNATPVLEHVTGRPATSRGVPTLIRLADRFAE